MAEFRSVGIVHVPNKMVVLRSGYKHEASTGFVRALKRMKDAGEVESSGGKTLCLTLVGEDAVPDQRAMQRATTNEDHRARIEMALGTPKVGDLLGLLVDRQPKERMELAAMMGYKSIASTGFAKAAAILMKFGFIEKAAAGSLQITEKAFVR